jgi:hypothetical protein
MSDAKSATPPAANEPAAKPKPEPEKPKQKISDRPHLWTVLLSSIAIVVSALSYIESHRSRLINEEVNRPLVRAISVNLVGPIMPKEQFQGSKFQNGYTITFRNTGKAFADNVHIDFKAQIEDSRAATGRKDFARFSDFQDATIRSEDIGDLAPDDEYPLFFWALVLKTPPAIRFGDNDVPLVSLYVKGNATYINPINGLTYHQPFCFSDPGTQGTFRRCSDSEVH